MKFNEKLKIVEKKIKFFRIFN